MREDSGNKLENVEKELDAIFGIGQPEDNSNTINRANEKKDIGYQGWRIKTPSNKKLIIAIAVFALAILVTIILIPSKFERVEAKCVKIVGVLEGGNDYFKIDTKPDAYDLAFAGMDDGIVNDTVKKILAQSNQEKALEAIRYANEELGFSSVYSQMMNTTALMGRQTEENKKYKVAWTYHPDNGLEVTYSKK